MSLTNDATKSTMDKQYTSFGVVDYDRIRETCSKHRSDYSDNTFQDYIKSNNAFRTINRNIQLDKDKKEIDKLIGAKVSINAMVNAPFTPKSINGEHNFSNKFASFDVAAEYSPILPTPSPIQVAGKRNKKK